MLFCSVAAAALAAAARACLLAGAAAAAGFRRALLDASPFAALLRSCSYTKKMNLADDAAQWTGWQVL